MATRTTISVPAELKAEMDRVSDHANWSAVASEAFCAEIRRIKTRQAVLKGEQMDTAVERLKVSKQRYILGAKHRGNACGVRWAQEAAEYEELKRFADMPPLEPTNTSLDGGPTELFLLMARGRDADRSWQAVLDFWNRNGSGDALDRDSGDFWNGFFEGVLEVHDRVIKELD